MSARAERVSWFLLALVVAVAMLAGATADRAPATRAERVRSIASGVRCPTCRGLSAAESDAKAAQAVRTEIAKRVADGESDARIRAYLVSRYGDDILLKPKATGFAGVVWALPVAALVVTVAALAFAFRRWRRAGAAGGPTDDDRAIVERALSGSA